MNIHEPAGRIVKATLVLPLILISSVAWGQGDQRLTEGVMIGPILDNANGDQGVFSPLVDSLPGEPDFTTFVAPAPGRDFRDVAIAADGRTVVLDGNLLHVYRRVFDAGTQQFIAVEDGVVDCTSLEFTTFKKNGQPIPGQTLSSCSSFTVLADGTWRIAGRVGNGGGPEMIGYDPTTGLAALKASETPPEVTAIVGDLAEKTGQGQVYYWVGERKKIGKSGYNPAAIDSNEPPAPEPFQVISTLKGKSIDDLTILADNRLAVVTESGELWQVYIDSGAASQFAVLDTDALCGLGKKDPQTFSLSNLGGQIFVANRGCQEITIFDDQDPPMLAQDVTNNPLKLTNPADLYPERLEVFAGRGGDFLFCGDTLATGCPLGLVPNAGSMWDLELIEPFPTLYREFEFVVDACNIIGPYDPNEPPPAPAGCPIVNAGDPPEDWVLDLMQLWLQTEDGPIFKQLAYGDGEPEQVLLPAYLRAQTRVPVEGAMLPIDCGRDPDLVPEGCVEIDPKIISIVIVSNALFTETFFVDYLLNEFLQDLFPTDNTNDQCDPLPFESTVGQANEVYPPIVYHSTDGFGTINRGGDLLDRGGYIMTDFCDNRGSGPRWSSNTINVEFNLPDENNDGSPDADALVQQAQRMADELQQVKEELICAPFANPDYVMGDPSQGPESLGPLLEPTGQDCSAIQGELDQVQQKLGVCFAALQDPQGNSQENCNALFTKTTNLQSRIDVADWPDPFDPANRFVLQPNYEGEFVSRLSAFVFFMQEFVIKAVPPGGISGGTP